MDGEHTCNMDKSSKGLQSSLFCVHILHGEEFVPIFALFLETAAGLPIILTCNKEAG